MWKSVAGAFVLVCSSCDMPKANNPGVNAKTSVAGITGSNDAQPQNPASQGKALANDINFYPSPHITIDPAITGTDRSALEEILAASLSSLSSKDFLTNAAQIDSAYPTVYLHGQSAMKASDAARLLQEKPTVGGFMATEIRIVPSRRGAGVDLNAAGNGLVMEINRLPLDNWAAQSRVQKSCAINTVAHEISHTLSRSATSWASVFVDSETGNSTLAESRRKGTTGSYVMGNLAQCSHLRTIGRIPGDQVVSCVPVWYFYSPVTPTSSETSGFANLRCTNFQAENDAVRL